MDCIAEIGMDPQGVQKCVEVSNQVYSIDNIVYSNSSYLGKMSYDHNRQCKNVHHSGGNWNSQRLLGLRLLGYGISWSWLPHRIKKAAPHRLNDPNQPLA